MSSAQEALANALGERGKFVTDEDVSGIILSLQNHGYYIAPITPATTGVSRTTDPRTSHRAEAAITLKAGTQRFLLLEQFGRWPDDGLTDEQAMEKANGVSPSSEYAKRCSELRAAGWIRDSGRDRKGNSGLDRIVSEITELGKAALAQARES